MPYALGISVSLISPSSGISGALCAEDSAFFFALPEASLGMETPWGRLIRRPSASNQNFKSDSFETSDLMTRSSMGRARIAWTALEYPEPSGCGLIPEKMNEESETM